MCTCSTAHSLPNNADVFPPYEDVFIELVELVYGTGYLSQDGDRAIKQLFEGIDLNGKYMLDIGCGLGGIDILIAKKFSANLIGIDPQVKLIDRARVLSKNNKNLLKGSLAFQLLEHPTILPFANNSFDIVFSRESILHVPITEKQLYFKEMLRVLKPGGKLIICDWCHKTTLYSDALKKMIAADNIPFHMITVAEYCEKLTSVGFSNINVKDDTKAYVAITQHDINRIKELKSTIEERFGSETYTYSLESWGLQKQCFEQEEVLLSIFTAVKPL